MPPLKQNKTASLHEESGFYRQFNLRSIIFEMLPSAGLNRIRFKGSERILSAIGPPSSNI